ncbi:MAG: FAD/NAD(P)-binding protein [Candidatus Wildermuthbacteria bacterium]|nr:FAD/NAD(P)-binding protein [Candidatus Wildermuthbacteria bacterium]
MENIYLPQKAEIIAIKQETPDTKTFSMCFVDDSFGKAFDYKPGQFVEFSVFGEGEATFCISNSPTRGFDYGFGHEKPSHGSPTCGFDYRKPNHGSPTCKISSSGTNGAIIECSVKKMGKVTQALHDLDVGDIVGIRGPYGNGFPINDLKGKNLLFVAGGIGLAPLRSLINYCIDKRGDYKFITIVNGARTSKDLVYKDEYPAWEKARDTKLYLTVDCEEDNWACMVGVVPKILEQLKPTCQDSVAIVCGPPVMIKYTMPVLLKIGFCPEEIITTLEMKMKCGVGKCGRCNIGNLYICKDGPVFSYAQLKGLPNEH